MKKFGLKMIGIFLGVFLCMFQAHAVDINVNLNPTEQIKLQQAYAKAYGFTPAQVAPLSAAPATEAPLILQVAQSAGVLPLQIWSMRQMGMSYANILQRYTLPPTVLVNPGVPYDRFGSALAPVVTYQQQYPGGWPSTVVLSDPTLIELAKIKYFTQYAKIPAVQIISLPTNPIHFSHLVIAPTRASPYFIPPGQAKKLGLWEPPGQAKKHSRIGLVDHPQVSKKQKWKEEDHSLFKKKEEKGHGRWK